MAARKMSVIMQCHMLGIGYFVMRYVLCMTLTLAVRKWNSMAEQVTLKKYNATYMVRIPPSIIRLINWTEGMTINVDVSLPNNIILSPAVQKKEE